MKKKDSDFWKNVEKCSKEVSTWPTWKLSSFIKSDRDPSDIYIGMKIDLNGNEAKIVGVHNLDNFWVFCGGGYTTLRRKEIEELRELNEKNK